MSDGLSGKMTEFAARELTVGTLNLWGRWSDWPRRLATLTATFPMPGPDVLMLQEVRHDRLGDQAVEVAEALGYAQHATAAGHEADDGTEGIAILSRFPLDGMHAETLPVSAPARRLLVAQAMLPAGRVTLICAHTVAVPHVARREQIRALLARPDDPLILAADLNEPPSALSGPLAAAGLRDCLHGHSAPTWPTCRTTFAAAWRARLGTPPAFSLEPRRLDYVLSRGVLPLHGEIHELGLDGHHASDHAMVCGTFRLVGGRTRSTSRFLRPAAAPVRA